MFIRKKLSFAVTSTPRLPPDNTYRTTKALPPIGHSERNTKVVPRLPRYALSLRMMIYDSLLAEPLNAATHLHA